MATIQTNQSGLQVIAENELHQVLLAYGIAKPGAVPGYLPGALFIDSDTTEVYKNAGTVASASFVEIAALAGGTFTDDVTFADGVNLIVGTTTGTKIGTATTQKLGFFNATPVAQQAALTAQSTALTHTAPVTPDFAIQDLTQTTPFGFATKDEGNTVLQVIANLQTRMAEMEVALEALGFVAAN